MAKQPQDWRAIYARQFNTIEDNVRYWSELTPSQQDFANHSFCHLNMSDHVYAIGSTGFVICRRMVAYGDDQGCL